ncbi:MAG TPA: IS110 family transposase [Bacillota bacterium]|nr:IS110 family transposase [Bacillota bacterium]
MFKNQNEKLQLIQPGTILIGLDAAKRSHWAQSIHYNGILIGKAFNIKNNREGLESLLVKIELIKQQTGCRRVIVGIESTGHYWKALAWFLMQNGIAVVLVNPHHVKKSKELDDNAPSKSDPKDAKIIAGLVKDGRFMEVYIPQGVYGELRMLSNLHAQLTAKLHSVKCIITAILDEYFPEFETVFKSFYGKTALYILGHCPFPEELKCLGIDGITAEIKKAVKRGVGRKRAESLYQVACDTIGLPTNDSAKLKLWLYLDEFNNLTGQIETVEQKMKKQLTETGISEYILSIKGIGIVIAAGILGEIGDPSRFANWKQIRKLAGFNLVEDSSGERKGKHKISKRGRSLLRSYLYQAAVIMGGKNPEFKKLYWYLITRKENPLKKKQALVALSIKLIRIMKTLINRKEKYDPSKVLGPIREIQLQEAA